MKKYLYVGILIILSIVPLLDLFHFGLPLTHDGQDHVARIANFYQSLSEGNIVPRWAANLNWGYGHPILMFLYPLPSYFASLFHFIGFSLIDSVKLVFALGYIASGLTMYLFVKALLKDEYSSLIASLLYLYAPYRFVDLYVRGALGEHVAFIFPPLILYFLLKISEGKKNLKLNFILVCLSLACLILSHNAISLMFLPIILSFMGYFVFQAKSLKLLYLYLSVLVFGFLISAFFWIPAFFEGKYTLRDIVSIKDFSSRFVDPLALLHGVWNYGGTGEFTTQIGLLHLFFVLSSVVTLFMIKNKKQRMLLFTFIGFFVLSIFLMLYPSKIIWDKVTILQKFQFPWRLLSISVFTASVVGGLLINNLPIKLKPILISFCIIILFILNKDYWYAKGFLERSESFFTGIYRSTTDTGESSPVWSVRFMESAPKDHIETIGKIVKIEKVKRTSTNHTYKVTSSDKIRLVENTLYFPGWHVLVDEKEVSIEFQDQAHRGLITFFVDKGDHMVEVIFKETRLRFISDMISIIGFLGLLILLLVPQKIWQRFL